MSVVFVALVTLKSCNCDSRVGCVLFPPLLIVQMFGPVQKYRFSPAGAVARYACSPRTHVEGRAFTMRCGMVLD